MKPIIKKLKMEEGYNPIYFHNPCKYIFTYGKYVEYVSNLVIDLVNHKNMIQKAALDIDPEVPIDNSVPNYHFIESVGLYIYLCYIEIRV